MKLCSDEHPEVCYASRECPVCVEIRESVLKTRKIENLHEQICDAQNRIATLEKQLAEVAK